MTRLIQIVRGDERRVALVEEPHLRLLENCASIYALALDAIASAVKLTTPARQKATNDSRGYDAIYNNRSEWRVLPPIDHPSNPHVVSSPERAYPFWQRPRTPGNARRCQRRAQVQFAGFGRTLRNPVRAATTSPALVDVIALG